MKNSQKGFANIILLVVIVAIVAVGGYFIFGKKSTVPLSTSQPQSNTPSKTSDLIIQETKELALGITGSHPKFSPNGNKILLESRDKSEGLWIVNIDGSDLENIYKGSLSAVDDYEWSPDGKFVFVVTLTETSSRFAGSKDEVISVINVQSKEIKQIFGPTSNILYPEWISKNEIAFIYEIYKSNENKFYNENFAIFDINGEKKNYQDGGQPVFFYTSYRNNAGDQATIKSVTRDGIVKELTGTSFSYPTISLDGKKIVFSGSGQLMTMNIDGSEKMTVTNDSGAVDAVWSPSGKIIAYSVEKDDGHAILEWDIYAINSDGTGKIKLTNSGKKFASNPRWSPDGKKLVFNYNETGKIGVLIFK